MLGFFRSDSRNHTRRVTLSYNATYDEIVKFETKEHDKPNHAVSFYKITSLLHALNRVMFSVRYHASPSKVLHRSVANMLT